MTCGFALRNLRARLERTLLTAFANAFGVALDGIVLGAGVAAALAAVDMTSSWPSAGFWLVSRPRQPFHKLDYDVGI
jgi:hypothetical protein